jgi:hypothetical protein
VIDLDSLLLELRARDIRLRVQDDDRLSIDAPKGVLREEDLDQLRRHKAQVIELLKRVDGRKPQRLRRQPAAEHYPVSFEQQGLWLVVGLEASSAAYNMPLLMKLHGVLDVAALRRAVQAVAARHESLRTVFRMIGGELRQMILPESTVDLRIRRLAGGQEHLHALAAREAGEPFDLERGPLFRASLIEIGRARPVADFASHHRRRLVTGHSAAGGDGPLCFIS